LHKFIKAYVTSEGGDLVDICEEYFTVEFSGQLSPTKYTYQPVVSRESKIDLIATGSPALESIVRDCLSKGILSSVLLRMKESPEELLRNRFKDIDYSCELCEKVNIKNRELSFCTRSPRCYHRINNAKIESVKIEKSEPLRLFQFYFSVLFRNKLRKNEEMIKILIDEEGNLHHSEILENPDLELIDSTERLDVALFDKLNAIVNETLDSVLEEKKGVFDMPLKRQVVNRLRTLERKLEEERLQRTITKKSWQFDEENWEVQRNAILKGEEEALKTQISVKFLNLLLVRTERIHTEIHLTNNSRIRFSHIVGLSESTELQCPRCKKLFSSGYATEDGFYLCEDCIKQSLETRKIYSSDFDLDIDSTTNEYIEKNEGFRCSVCGSLNSKFFEFRCSHDGSQVCYNCYDVCAKCGKLFSTRYMERCKESGNPYCREHLIRCDNCGSPVGVDKYSTCEALGKKVCSCTKFQSCICCEQQYSTESLVGGKCPACTTLIEVEDRTIISPIVRLHPSLEKTKRWLVGRNSMNSIIIAKSLFSDTLFVLRESDVVYQKKISFINKMKGY
jgi:hypothetical protein